LTDLSYRYNIPAYERKFLIRELANSEKLGQAIPTIQADISLREYPCPVSPIDFSTYLTFNINVGYER